MATTFTIPDGYGYVILTFVASIFMLLWKGIQVRKLINLMNFDHPVSNYLYIFGFFKDDVLVTVSGWQSTQEVQRSVSYNVFCNQ